MDDGTALTIVLNNVLNNVLKNKLNNGCNSGSLNHESHNHGTKRLEMLPRWVLIKIVNMLKSIAPHCVIAMNKSKHKMYANNIWLSNDGNFIMCTGTRKIIRGYGNVYDVACTCRLDIDDHDDIDIDGKPGLYHDITSDTLMYRYSWTTNKHYFVLSCSADNKFHILDTNTGKCIATFSGHTDYVQALDVSMDGSRIVSGSRDGTFMIWNAQTAQPIGTIDACRHHIDFVKHVAISEKYIVTSFVGRENGQEIFNNDISILIWCSDTLKHLHTVGKVPGTLVGSSSCGASTLTRFMDFCMFHDKKHDFILYTNDDEKIFMWNLATISSSQPTRQFIGHTELVTTLAVSADGMCLCSGSCDTTVRIWNTATGQSTHCIDAHINAVKFVRLSNSGQNLVVASLSTNNELKVWKSLFS